MASTFMVVVKYYSVALSKVFGSVFQLNFLLILELELGILEILENFWYEV